MEGKSWENVKYIILLTFSLSIFSTGISTKDVIILHSFAICSLYVYTFWITLDIIFAPYTPTRREKNSPEFVINLILSHLLKYIFAQFFSIHAMQIKQVRTECPSTVLSTYFLYFYLILKRTPHRNLAVSVYLTSSIEKMCFHTSNRINWSIKQKKYCTKLKIISPNKDILFYVQKHILACWILTAETTNAGVTSS